MGVDFGLQTNPSPFTSQDVIPFNCVLETQLIVMCNKYVPIDDFCIKAKFALVVAIYLWEVKYNAC